MSTTEGTGVFTGFRGHCMREREKYTIPRILRVDFVSKLVENSAQFQSCGVNSIVNGGKYIIKVKES